MTWKEAAAPLARREFRWFFAARVVNLLGLTMASVALAFAVLDLTGSAADLGLVLAAHTVPLVLFLLVGGVVADRFPRTTVIRVASLGSALAQGVTAALFVSGTASLGAVMALAAVSGSMSAITFPAMAALLPQVTDRQHLQQANALVSAARGAITVVGPTVGALLVVTVGAGWALAVDALAWAVAGLLLLPVRSSDRVADRRGDGVPRPGTLAELREGWTVFRGTPWLWQVVLGASVLNALHSGVWLTLGPAQATRTIGAQGWGLVLSAESVGLLLMTAVLLRVRLARPLLWGTAGLCAFALPLVVMGARPHLGVLVVATLLAGAGMELFAMGWNLAMQEHVAEDHLSRAYSYDALGSFAAMPVGQLAFGPLGEHVGYGVVLVAGGVVWLAVCGLVLTSRPVRSLPRAAAGTPVPSAT